MTVSKGPWPFPTREHHPASGEGVKPQAVPPSEDSIDHGVEESFPASDPVSVTVTVVPTVPAPQAEVPGQPEARGRD